MKHNTLALIGALASLPLANAAQPAQAQSWPSQTVKIVSPFPPGSGGDVTARQYADRLAKRWGRPVIVENRPGADGIVAVTTVTGSNDGHTLLYTNGGPLTSNLISHGGKLPYDPARDLVPISSAVEAFVGIGVPASMGVTSLKAFVDLARSQPGQLNWGATAGALDYLIPAFFKSASIELVRVPYRDVSFAMQDLSQARLHLYVSAVATQLPMVQAGSVKILAVTSGERAPGLESVPTVDEAGFPGLRFEAFLGFFGPRAMPEGIRDRISADIRAVSISEDLDQKFEAIAMKVRATTPAELEKMVARERATLNRIAVPAQSLPAR